MPSSHHFDWFLILLATIAGLVGGCGSAAYQVLSGRQLSISIFLAYATLGAVLGAFSFVLLVFLTSTQDVQTVLMFAGLMGMGSTTSVAVIRVGVKAILRAKGIEIDVQVRQTRPEKQDRD